ncbi:MAG TPA: hypothetical protein VLV15_08775, partial [Dongiaceae bacterium]|nr:hypothetical protein [Dongiaceae bacterium]
MSKFPAFILAVVSLSSGTASALTIAPNPIPLVGTGGAGGSIVGSVELVGTASGVPLGGVVSFGSIAPSDTSLIFRITLDPSSAPVAYFAVSSADTVLPPAGGSLVYSGAGVIPGAGTDITLLEITVDPSVVIFGVTVPGSVSDLFFVAYPTPPAAGEF